MAKRKKRTRQHIIADLSENHFEKIALIKGFSVERTFNDYGYDILMFTYNNEGEIENGYVSVQLKATDGLTIINDGEKISFTVDKKDLDLWIKEFNPVILVVYDARTNNGYWQYIQGYFKSQKINLEDINKTLNIHIPIKNKVGKRAMTFFSLKKSKLYKQIEDIEF